MNNTPRLCDCGCGGVVPSEKHASILPGHSSKLLSVRDRMRASLGHPPVVADTELVALARSGVSLTDIARGVGVSRERIRQRVKRADPTWNGQSGPKSPRHDHLAIGRVFKDTNESVRETAKKIGCSVGVVRDVVNRLGIRTYPQPSQCLPTYTVKLRRDLVRWIVQDLADERVDRVAKVQDVESLLGRKLQLYFGGIVKGVRPRQAVTVREIWESARARKGLPGGRQPL